jgi:hypothetical protein
VQRLCKRPAWLEPQGLWLSCMVAWGHAVTVPGALSGQPGTSMAELL